MPWKDVWSAQQLADMIADVCGNAYNAYMFCAWQMALISTWGTFNKHANKPPNHWMCVNSMHDAEGTQVMESCDADSDSSL